MGLSHLSRRKSQSCPPHGTSTPSLNGGSYSLASTEYLLINPISIRYAHEPPALHAGLSPASVAHIRNDLPPPCSTMTEDENVYYAFCYQQFHQKRVDQETWEGVRRLIGEKGGIELNAMMAFYTCVEQALGCSTVIYD